MKLSDQITRRHLFVAFGSSAQTGTLSSVDLAATRDGSSVTLTASDGSVAPIAGADASTAGVLTAADKTRLDALPPTSGQRFSARAGVASTTIEAAITHLTTAGYAAPGDGGGAVYRRVGAEPAHALKVQSADGAWWELVPDMAGVSMRQAGAVGDGATDDTTAFQDVADYIEHEGGGTVLVPRGNYIVGRQTPVLDGTTSYTASPDVFRVQGCARPVRLIGNQAVIKIVDGLRYGSFHPDTGAAANDADTVDLGYLIRFDDCASVEVANLEIDGNSTRLIVGGTIGGSRQVIAYNLYINNCGIVAVRNVHTHHSALDNLYVTDKAMTSANDDRTPMLIENVASEYAGRQGFTWAGGKGLVCFGSKFNHTGRAVNQGGPDSAIDGSVLHTTPGAGLDIEAEGGGIVRDGQFINCEFVNNAGKGMIAFSGDSADVIFDGCRFWGTSNNPIAVNKPRYRFRDCRIFGVIEVLHSPTDAVPGEVHPDAPHFLGCHFEDKPWSDGNVFTGTDGVIFNLFNRMGWLIEGGTIVHREVKGSRIGELRDGVLRRVYIESHIGSHANGGHLAIIFNTLVEDCYINDLAVHTTANGYYIADDVNTIYRNSFINSPDEKLKWRNWWTGGNGHTGPSGQGSGNHKDRAALYAQALNLHRDENRNAWKVQKVISAEEAPPSGTWNRGDIVLNYNATAAGRPLGWYCVNGGIPGTWHEIRCVGTQQAKILDPSGGTTIDVEARTAIAAIVDVLEHFGLSSAT